MHRSSGASSSQNANAPRQFVDAATEGAAPTFDPVSVTFTQHFLVDDVVTKNPLQGVIAHHRRLLGEKPITTQKRGRCFPVGMNEDLVICTSMRHGKPSRSLDREHLYRHTKHCHGVILDEKLTDEKSRRQVSKCGQKRIPHLGICRHIETTIPGVVLVRHPARERSRESRDRFD